MIEMTKVNIFNVLNDNTRFFFIINFLSRIPDYRQTHRVSILYLIIGFKGHQIVDQVIQEGIAFINHEPHDDAAKQAFRFSGLIREKRRKIHVSFYPNVNPSSNTALQDTHMDNIC